MSFRFKPNAKLAPQIPSAIQADVAETLSYPMDRQVAETLAAARSADSLADLVDATRANTKALNRIADALEAHP